MQSLGGSEVEMYAAKNANVSKCGMGNGDGIRETDKLIMRNTEPYVPRMIISSSEGLPRKTHVGMRKARYQMARVVSV